MERTGLEAGAIREALVFLDYFKDLSDARQPGKVIYPLAEVLLLWAPRKIAMIVDLCESHV